MNNDKSNVQKIKSIYHFLTASKIIFKPPIKTEILIFDLFDEYIKNKLFSKYTFLHF